MIVEFARQDQAGLPGMVARTEFLRAEKDPQLKRHVEPRQSVDRVEFGPGNIVNSVAALSHNPVNFFQPILRRVVHFKSAARPQISLCQGENNSIPDGLVRAVERAVQEDALVVLAHSQWPAIPGRLPVFTLGTVGAVLRFSARASLRSRGCSVRAGRLGFLLNSERLTGRPHSFSRRLRMTVSTACSTTLSGTLRPPGRYAIPAYRVCSFLGILGSLMAAPRFCFMNRFLRPLYMPFLHVRLIYHAAACSPVVAGRCRLGRNGFRDGLAARRKDPPTDFQRPRSGSLG